jgi:hypothetical protein
VTRAAAAVWIVAAAACGGSGGGAPAAEPDVAIVGDSVRLRLADPLPATSPFFDGARVAITGARGEVVALQVLYRGERAVRVELAAPGIAVGQWAIEPVVVRRPSTSLWGPSRGAGAYPDRLRARTGAGPGPVLIEVVIARDAPAGPATGTITVGERAIPLEVTVAPVAIEPPGARPRVWAYYDAREVAAAVGGAVGSDAVRGAERACAAMLRAHGVMATPELTLESWNDRKDAVAGSPYVPVLLPSGDDAALAAAVAGWVAKLAGTSQVGFAIPIDEPRKEAQKREVRALADKVRAAGGGPGRFLYAVTDAPHPIYGDAIDLYISAFAVSRDGARTPERWTYNGTPPQAGAMTVDAGAVDLRTWGWIAYRWRVPLWYVWDGLYWHDRHNRKRRREDPMGGPPNAGHLDAVTFDDGEDHGNLDGVIALPPDERDGEPAAVGCVPTLRLKTLRRGLQDRALLDAYAACGGRARADALADRLVPTALADAPRGARASWPADEATWEAARAELLAGLRGCMM